MIQKDFNTHSCILLLKRTMTRKSIQPSVNVQKTQHDVLSPGEKNIEFVEQGWPLQISFSQLTTNEGHL